jgi:hypothetical protein
MTESITLWLLGGFASVFLVFAVSAINAHGKMSERVTRLEAVMALFGQKAAKLLHSPDDHLNIDALLDKYLDRNYELTFEDWGALLSQCEKIEEDKSLQKDTRTLAAWLSAIANHKLMNPPTIKRHKPLIN